MKGSEAILLGFMEGANNRYVIPVYQRKYDWKIDNCQQLYNDLKKIIIDSRSSHFFGSIVSQVVPYGANIEFHIIDGQQRLTTVTLLLLALGHLVKEGLVKTEEEQLDQQILQRFVIAPWAKKDDKIKLRPVKGDREALERLVAGDKADFDYASNLTINYNYFRDQILKAEITPDQLYEAIGKLQIISITLDNDDDAQLIFESLNSTGLALQEGDKIRNYILMGLEPHIQEKFYESYWTKIEKCTENDVSGFVRDYMSVKQQVTPTINRVYQVFKQYAEDQKIPIETLLSDLLRYARLFEKLLTGRSGLQDAALNSCLYRLNRLEITVTRPFFMEVLRLHEDNKLTTEDVRRVFLITEIYLFRRNICEVPTNALNKIFLNLNKEILRYDNTTNQYADKFIYALLSKKESGRFPDDNEFAEALANKQVYQMRGRYKAYLFERFENYGTIETKDVYEHLDKGTYSIEHIMPQHLTPAWINTLGPAAEEIHSTWLHRLANLTLTGYNSSLSNSTFQEKRDAEDGGYKSSGLRMNQVISQKDSWGLPELQERGQTMVEDATKKIWLMPVTSFVPEQKEFDSCSLDDENYDLTGRDIVKYSYQNKETPVTSWADMYEHVIKYLHNKDKSVLLGLAYSSSESTDLWNYFSIDEGELRIALKIDDQIYAEKNTSTALKISVLRRLFALYKEDPMDLVFYLRDQVAEKVTDESRHDLRRRYWKQAIPEIRKANFVRGCFDNCNPISGNWIVGSFGIGGFGICCIANYDEARIDFSLSKGEAEKNKEAFDLLYSHKDEIESALGSEVEWLRSESTKGSYIIHRLSKVSITNEADWPRMIDYHADWSKRFGDVIIPYLKELYPSVEDYDVAMKLAKTAQMFQNWVSEREESTSIVTDFDKCNRIYTRFKTEGMTKIFPDAKGTKSGWATENHYFYEIVNCSGNSFYIQLAISFKELPEDQRKICELIQEQLPARKHRDNWSWWVPFRTKKVSFDDDESQEGINTLLDKYFESIVVYEKKLMEKLLV